MMNPKAKPGQRVEAEDEEFRHRPAADYIYQFSDRAQSGTNPEVYRILGIPDPREKSTPARED